MMNLMPLLYFFRPHNISVHKKLFPPNIGTQNYLKEKEMKAKQNYEFPFFSIFCYTSLFEGSLISGKYKPIWLDELVNLFAIKFSV